MTERDIYSEIRSIINETGYSDQLSFGDEFGENADIRVQDGRLMLFGSPIFRLIDIDKVHYVLTSSTGTVRKEELTIHFISKAERHRHAVSLERVKKGCCSPITETLYNEKNESTTDPGEIRRYYDRYIRDCKLTDQIMKQLDLIAIEREKGSLCDNNHTVMIEKKCLQIIRVGSPRVREAVIFAYCMIAIERDPSGICFTLRRGIDMLREYDCTDEFIKHYKARVRDFKSEKDLNADIELIQKLSNI